MPDSVKKALEELEALREKVLTRDGMAIARDMLELIEILKKLLKAGQQRPAPDNDGI